MKLHAVTVCVNYADYLSRSLDRWAAAPVLVVTTPADTETQDLCHRHGVPVHTTNVFYASGAKFNKGAAIVEAIESRICIDCIDWLLLFDSDIIPPANWLDQVKGANLRLGDLYGAPRTTEAGELIDDGELAGYFHLFHTSDPNAKRRPLLDTHWYHAGNYDSEFIKRWDIDNRVLLPFSVIHLGERGRNWCGRGQADDMRQLHEERARRGGYGHETIKP